MDFKLTEDEEKRRKEFFDVCREMEKERPPGARGLIASLEAEAPEAVAYDERCRQEFAKRGWLRIGWPAEYKGIGTMMDRVFFAEATGYYGIPGVDIFGVGMLSPMLIQAATKEIKDRFLPPIGNGEVLWCEGYSEPNAGSDLANVSTTAIRKGDEYIINGQKTWTSGAHRADWMFGVFKSDLQARKHHNLSFLLMDVKSPGITIRPLLYFNGTHIYNEVFFDDVHVPADQIIGEENRGWEITQLLLGFERSNVGAVMSLRRQLDDLVEYCNETKVGGKLLAQDSVIRNRLAEMACNIEACRTLAYYIADQQRRPGGLGLFEASAIKTFSGDLTECMGVLGSDILGTYGQVKLSKWAPQDGQWESNPQDAFVLTISMGTNEIQKNIIAWAGLGMPRPPRPAPKA
jgi:hypothetical protein